MNDSKLFDTLLTQFGFAALLVVAVYLTTRKMARRHEMRITALESASARCVADCVNETESTSPQLIAP